MVTSPGGVTSSSETPVLDLSDYVEVFLHFRSETVVDSGARQEVLLSLDGGATFEDHPIFTYDPSSALDSGEEPFYAERTFPVPLAAGESQVAFAFRYESEGNSWWWAPASAG